MNIEATEGCKIAKHTSTDYWLQAVIHHPVRTYPLTHAFL